MILAFKVGSPTARICVASMPAFMAPLMAVVATGMPGGIWAMARSASMPSSEELIGTPMTGTGVIAAITPGRWAAMPAPAMMTSMPLPWAFLAKDSTSAGVRWAERALISKGMQKSLRTFAAFSMTGRSEVLPMIILTFGFMF